MSDRIDRVDVHAGIVDIPERYRQIARLANQAGLDGYEFVDAEVGMDLAETIEILRQKSEGEAYPELKSRVVIRYRPRADEAKVELLKACKLVKEYLNALEAGTAGGDPLKKVREMYHAPLHEMLDKAIKAAEGDREPPA